MGRMYRKMYDNGRTYKGRCNSCMLWLWFVYRWTWNGFWCKKNWCYDGSYVCRKYTETDYVYGRFWRNSSCMYTIICFISCRNNCRDGQGWWYEIKSRNSWSRALDRRNEKENWRHFTYWMFWYLRIMWNYRTGCCNGL